MVVSSSRDRTVRVWRRTPTSPFLFDCHVARHANVYVNALAYLPPDSKHPAGLVAAGDQDGLLEIVTPFANPTDNADRLLVGHAGNICTVDVSPASDWLVSGGWDGQVRVWSVDSWTSCLKLKHSDMAVWAVIALDQNTVATGSADKIVRIFDLPMPLIPSQVSGVVQPRSSIHTPDVVRALCRVPPNHPSGANLASASNDQVIRLWKLDGRQVGELHGHESFIYSLALLSTGEIASSGEDRTVRIWSGFDCIQTITHPALSVWSVSACPETSDIVTGASDGVARIFTRDPAKVADNEMIASFRSSVQASAIPRQQVSETINKEKIPGPEFLQTRSGRKEGQTQMIKEADGSISVHQWSSGSQQWVNIGTVVDSVGSSSRKVEYQGNLYDFVFDVDIEDGKPPLKLPFNATQNPNDRAAQFLEENRLPGSYLETVTRFIIENTQGKLIESGPAVNDAAITELGHMLPQRDYLSILAAKYDAIIKRILSVNITMISAGRKEAAFNPTDQATLHVLHADLEAGRPTSKAALHLVLIVITRWPYGDRLAGLDLLRCMAASSDVASHVDPHYGSLLDLATASAAGAGDEAGASTAAPAARENCTMMAIRVLVNLFSSGPGRATVCSDGCDAALRLLETPPSPSPANRNLAVAVATALINLAILARSSPAVLSPPARRRARILLGTLLGAPDPEARYRSLVALGTLPLDDANSAERADYRTWVQTSLDSCDDSRVHQVGVQCMALL